MMPAPASDAHRYHRTERVEADMLGECWLAEDLLLQRQVWVRMVPMPPLSPSDWGRRLHRLQELEHSHHPCWVPLVDVTQSPEGVELVYEPPKGVKLSQWLGRGPMTPAQAARCMLDLLSAFRQDTQQDRYGTRAELLDYCRRSANPVGRLLLHLYGGTPPTALRWALYPTPATAVGRVWVSTWSGPVSSLTRRTKRARATMPAAWTAIARLEWALHQAERQPESRVDLGSLALLGLGLAALVVVVRRRREEGSAALAA